MDLEEHEVNESKPLLGTSKHIKDLIFGRVAKKSTLPPLTPKEFTLRMTSLIAVQFFTFLAILALIATFYHYFPVMVFVSIGAVVLCGVLASAIYVRQPWQPWAGRFLSLSAIVATIIGLHLYYTQMLYYYHYRDATTYRNVAASQPAGMFADAGAIIFLGDSVVDVSKSVGFMSAEAGSVICVAPVLDASMQPESGINFFAFGTDCCGSRSQFDCDAASDSSAKAGIVMPNPRDMMSPLAALFFGEGPTMENLNAAVTMQEAVFGAPKEKVPKLFLRWVKDSNALQSGYLRATLLESLVASAAWLVKLTLMALLVVAGPQRIGEWARSTVR
jgi:hypothetical protein